MEAPPSKRAKVAGGGLTVQQIAEADLTMIAKENWASSTDNSFSPELVKQIYTSELHSDPDNVPDTQKVTLLEMSQYLEQYLWPNFDPSVSSHEHLFSVILMLNEKFRQRVSPWSAMKKEEFERFFVSVVSVDLRSCDPAERMSYIVFLMCCFQSLETEFVRQQVLMLVSLPLWHQLSPGRFQLELQEQPSLRKRWNRLLKKEAKDKKIHEKESTFFMSLLEVFLEPLKPGSEILKDSIEEKFCLRFIAFLIDLLSQLPTRRFLRTLLQDQAILIKCKMSELYKGSHSTLFIQMVTLFESYLHFNVDDHTGEPFSDEEFRSKHYEKLAQLQRLLFTYWSEKLKDFALMDCASLQKPFTLRKAMDLLSHQERIKCVVHQLKLVSADDAWTQSSEFLKEVFIDHFQKRTSEREQVSAMPSYPTESTLWDPYRIPDVQSSEDACVPVGRLNLQFLSFHDYLLRNHQLFLLETAYEIREEIVDILERLGVPMKDETKNQVLFKGWARMACPLDSFTIVEVRNPNLGQTKPSAVKAEIVFNTKFMRENVKKEWDAIRQHDVLFLLSVHPSLPSSLLPKGLQAVRGCELLEIRDEQGKLMNDFSTGMGSNDAVQEPSGEIRTLLVALDTAQYELDMQDLSKSQAGDVYGTFTVLMRRKAKENNFKSVLESIRDLMNEHQLDLDWLHDVFLGYGHPAAAHYTHLKEKQILKLDMKDTFIDADHIHKSFPDYKIQTLMDDFKKTDYMQCTFSSLPDNQDISPDSDKCLDVVFYTSSNSGPYPRDQPLRNPVRFTPVQVHSILSGLQPGLTMIVGPPGTGKTDTAVQILHLLFHNFPHERTLLITHSNQALNDLFQKLMERDVPARYLLRLGLGEEDLETDLDFSRVGRVNAMLERRLLLLSEIQKLASQLKVSEDMVHSCETAGHFWMLHVLARWEKFLTKCHAQKSNDCVMELFPFTEFFSDAPQPLFHQQNYEEDLDRAHGFFHHLKTIFQELEECRAFELLRNQNDRVNYLLTKQAKIIAMTCTHAALKRKDFLSIGLKYNNVLMEEAGQILEIETFIPLTLQEAENGGRALKRFILIGDHNQLPPIVKHPSFQKYNQMDQSLFTRLIRLGVPYFELDAQGRCRQSLASLFNWKYKKLGDLEYIKTDSRFQIANAGFRYEHQWIDVSDQDGAIETTPTPFFYQNLAEAEHIVKLYQFMRLIGYPSKSISILTTYNGQKHLLEDIITKHCALHPAFGRPHRVATVDKFQGQQNQFILLSLVRTKAFGHLRDIRRLIVATSRAQLGFYIFGKADLFKNCVEMQPTFEQWSSRPMKLALVKGESYGQCSRNVTDPGESTMILSLEEMHQLVNQMTKEWEAHLVARKEDIAQHQEAVITSATRM